MGGAGLRLLGFGMSDVQLLDIPVGLVSLKIKRQNLFTQQSLKFPHHFSHINKLVNNAGDNIRGISFIHVHEIPFVTSLMITGLGTTDNN